MHKFCIVNGENTYKYRYFGSRFSSIVIKVVAKYIEKEEKGGGEKGVR